MRTIVLAAALAALPAAAQPSGPSNTEGLFLHAALDGQSIEIDDDGDGAEAEGGGLALTGSPPCSRSTAASRAPASTLGNYASLFKARGDYARAEDLQTESLRITRLAAGPDHYTTAMQTLKLASIVQRRQDWARAARLYREGLAGLEPTMARGDLSIEYNRQGLGACLTALGRYPEAERILVDAYLHTRDAHGPDDRSTQALLESVVSLYQAWGRPDAVARYVALRAVPTPA